MKELCFLPLALWLVGCASHDYRPYVGAQQNWPTAAGAFVERQHDVYVYHGYPPQPYTLMGELVEGVDATDSDEVGDAAKAAHRLGADAIIVQDHHIEEHGTVTRGMTTSSGTGSMMTQPSDSDNATVLLIRWKPQGRATNEAENLTRLAPRTPKPSSIWDDNAAESIDRE